MVGNRFGKRKLHVLRKRFAACDKKLSPALSERYSLVHVGIIFGKGIESSHKLAGVEVDCVVAFFEFVQFFQNDNRNNQIVLLKIVYTPEIVQDNIGIQHKCFFVSTHNSLRF